MVASGSDDRTVKLWDVVHASLIHTFTDHCGMVNGVSFHPDGTCLASGSTDKKIKIFDVRSQKLLQHYDAHNDAVNSVSFHSNGVYLTSTSNDSTVKIWDLRKGQILYTLFGHEGPTVCASFSPLGDYLLSGGADSNLVVWNTALNPTVTEELYGMTAARITTETFITDKADIKKLPEEKPPVRKNPKKHQQSAVSVQTYQVKNETTPSVPQRETLGARTHKGPNYRQLKPEVKQCLDKVIYQLDLCCNTLNLLETRISVNESKLSEVVDYIKTEDINYVSVY
jgi:centriolar protein POC1